MKLSEAMRLGAMMGPQVYGRYFYRDGSCALGSLALAMGVHVGQFCIDDGVILPQVFSFSWPAEVRRALFHSGMKACPECGGANFTLESAISHLNDLHRWTRERIADWVDSVEREREAHTEQAQAETQEVLA